MNITGSKQVDVSATVPKNITGSNKSSDEVKMKSVYVAETDSLIFVPEDYTPEQQTAVAKQEEFEQINNLIDEQSFYNRYIATPAKTGSEFAGVMGKSAYNQAIDLSLGTLLRAEAWAENTGAEIAADRAKKRGMYYPNTLLQIRRDTLNRNREISNAAQVEIGEDESEVAQNLGSGIVSIGSMFLAFGLGRKEAALDLAKIFGLSSGTSMYENLTMAGAPYDTATYRGAIAGGSEYGLEKIGFDWLTNRIANKRLYPIMKRWIAAPAVGAAQESAQEGKDILLEQGYVESTPDEKLDRLINSAVYGAILETAGAEMGYQLYRRQISKDIEKQALEAGYDTKTARKIAKASTPSTSEMLNTLREEEANVLENTPQYTPEQLDEMEQSLNLSRDLDNADAVAEVRFYDNMREALRQGNLSEPEQRRQALSLSLTAKNQYETLKEMGTYGGGLADFIEENYQRFTVADREDTRATLNNGQMTETPARMSEEEIEEAWAEYQERNRTQMTDEERYRNEDQRLFSAAAAMYPNPRTDIGSFYEFVKNNPNHKKSYMVFKSKGGLPLDILSDTIKHDNSEHNLSIDEWRDALENVDNIEEAIFSARPTSYGNRSYLLKIKTPKRKYGMAVAYVNGHNYVTTLFKTTDKGYEQWVNKTNKKTAVAPAPYPQAGSSSTQRGNVSYGLSVESIVQLLKSNVNKKDIRNNKTLFSKENNQLPPDAYDAQGKADINTPEFKNWFGDSKVVDENGEPLVVYHGGAVFDTFIPEKTFDGAFYFSPNKNMARDYANEVYGENGSEVKAVYISIQNPTTTIPSSKKQVQELKKQGYDGVIYKGKNGAEIIAAFEPNQIKSVYNRGMFSHESNNIYYSNSDEKVYGTYDPSEHLIELFKDARPDTLTHELSHYFFQSYFTAADKYGYSDYDRGVLRWLSKQGKHDIKSLADMQNQDWENLTEAWIRYLNTGNAPTIATRGIFQKAKEWVLDLFEINRDYASDEVKDFFDNLFSREGKMPNLDAIEQNRGDLKEALRRALNGESATFRNINRKQIRDLRAGINRRIRRQGRTLAQELRSMGYRVDTLNGKLLDGNGIVEDNALAEIFKDLGVIENIDTETYEQTDALSTQMQNILQDAENTYSPRERAIQTEHDEGVQAQLRLQEIVNDLLQDNQLGIKSIEELDELLARIESKPDNVDIVKVNRDAIKYLQAKTTQMDKDFRNAIRQVRQQEKVNRENQYQLQERITNFIRSLPVTGDHKASLMGNIRRVKDEDSFAKVMNEVRDRARGYIEQEQKQLNRNNIEETIKSTKPAKFRKQRYTYEDNKFFAELRDILKMSRAEALKAQEEYAKQIGLDRADGDVPLGISISEYDRLKNLLYHYKINGAESSLSALQDLATSLEELKSAAMNKRLDEDMLKSEVRKKDKDELLTGIDSHERSNWFAWKMSDIGTIYSTMNEYFGKKMADKWNLEVDFEKVNIFLRSRIKPVMDNAREIYGARRTPDFLNLIQQKTREDFELTDNDGDYQKLSILDIADIYLGMKDPNTRANYYASYEKFDDTMPTDKGQLRVVIEGMTDEQLKEHMLTNNLGTLLSYLTEQDMRFADMVQEEVGSMWALENEIFVKLYGIDLPRNKNYFPRTSKNSLDYDVMENLRVRGQTPGFFKERASTVTPRPKNIWLKYQEYVSSVGYVQNVALKYKDLRSLMTDRAIRGAITRKYGEDSYRAFMANLDDLSIKGAMKTYNEVGKTMQKLLNNLVSGTVALNVPMAFKQLPAALNYSVNMPKTEFVKNFLYAATHPAEVKKVMDSYVGDFLKTRFEQGSQSDAIGRAMAEANNLASSKFGLAGFSHSWRTFATAPIRFADIFAIYWGGYAKLKYNVDRGLTAEQVRNDFIRETLFNQAAGNPATLAKFQREQSWRFFTAFRNVPAQYMRLLTTTMTQWRRGEISNDRFYSNIGNYVFIQPAMYVWLGWLIKSLLYGDDDDEWYDGMMTEMALAPIAGLPIIADLAGFGLDKAESAITGKSPEPWDALQVFGVDSLNRLLWKLAKGDKTEWDYAEIVGSLIDVGTGAGLGTAVRTVKKMTD